MTKKQKKTSKQSVQVASDTQTFQKLAETVASEGNDVAMACFERTWPPRSWFNMIQVVMSSYSCVKKQKKLDIVVGLLIVGCKKVGS